MCDPSVNVGCDRKTPELLLMHQSTCNKTPPVYTNIEKKTEKTEKDGPLNVHPSITLTRKYMDKYKYKYKY